MTSFSELLEVLKKAEAGCALAEGMLPDIQKTLLDYWKRKDGVAPHMMEHSFVLNDGTILGNTHKDLTHKKLLLPIAKNQDPIEVVEPNFIATGAIRVFLEDYGDILHVSIECSGKFCTYSQKDVLAKFLRGKSCPIVVFVEILHSSQEGYFILDSNEISISRMLSVLFNILDGKIQPGGRYWHSTVS